MKNKTSSTLYVSSPVISGGGGAEWLFRQERFPTLGLVVLWSDARSAVVTLWTDILSEVAEDRGTGMPIIFVIT